MNRVLLLDEDLDAIDFLREYFQETSASLSVVKTKKDLQSLLTSGAKFPLLFIDTNWGDKISVDQLGLLKSPSAKVISIGKRSEHFPSDAHLEKPIDHDTWERGFYKTLAFKNPVKVLIVDDELDLCTELKEFLELRKPPNFSVSYATNGLEGFEKLRKEKPDLMILDLKMPVKSGIDLFHDLTRAHILIPSIVLSATVSSEELEAVRKYGSAIFIEKGSRESSFPRLADRLKKLAAFGINTSI